MTHARARRIVSPRCADDGAHMHLPDVPRSFLYNLAAAEGLVAT